MSKAALPWLMSTVQHLARVSQDEYIPDEFQQLGLVVADTSRQHPFTMGSSATQ